MLHSTAIVATALLCCSAALCQRINLNITQREGGGETVGVVRELPDDDTRKPREAYPAADTGAMSPQRLQQFIHFSAQVREDITRRGLIAPHTAATCRTAMSGTIALSPASFEGYDYSYSDALWLLMRVESMPPTRPQKMDQLLDMLKRSEGDTPGLLRFEFFWRMLIGDAEGTRRTFGALKDACESTFGDTYAPWLRYHSGFVGMAGQTVELKITRADGKVVSTHAGTALALLFRPEGHKGETIARKLSALIGKSGRCEMLQAVLSDGNAAGEAKLPPDALSDQESGRLISLFNITALPTAIILDGSGGVLFAGDANSWECARAIEQAGAPTPEGIQPLAARELGLATPPADPKYHDDKPQTPRPTDLQELAAKRANDAAWDRARLALKTNNPALKQQALDEFRECIRLYPGTRGAEEAQRNLRDLERR